MTRVANDSAHEVSHAHRGYSGKRLHLAAVAFVAFFAVMAFRVGGLHLQSLTSVWARWTSESPAGPTAKEDRHGSERAPGPLEKNQPVGAHTTVVALPGADSSTSKVPLPLVLVRTEPGRDVHEGRAFLGTSRANPQTYRAGALLANGARLEEVHRDHVVIERAGRRASIYMHGMVRDPHASAGLLTVGGEPEPKIERVTTQEVFTQYIRSTPIYDGALIKGYEVYPGPKSSVFTRMGLHNGDVIVALDGAPLSDPQQAMDMFAQLVDGAALTAVIDRKGTRERVRLDGAVIIEDRGRAGREPAYAGASPGPAVVSSR